MPLASVVTSGREKPVPVEVRKEQVRLVQEAEKGSGSFCGNRPEDATHKMNLTPFPLAAATAAGHQRVCQPFFV